MDVCRMGRCRLPVDEPTNGGATATGEGDGMADGTF